jgi:hypothetical protein
VSTKLDVKKGVTELILKIDVADINLFNERNVSMEHEVRNDR